MEAISSNSARGKLSDALKAALAQHVKDELVPALRAALALALPTQPTSIEVSADAEKLWVYYPSAVENTDTYMRSSILIEFGGRNSTLPQSTLAIAPDVAVHVPGLALPTAQVSVLSAARTFWEKATLIHVECHRPGLKPSAQRLSRHWYDLARLADHELGQQALQDMDLLRDVLRIKETFYRSGFSHYDRCAKGGLKLIPEASMLEALRLDYQAMLTAQMFYGDTVSFEAIVERLEALELEINRTTKEKARSPIKHS